MSLHADLHQSEQEVQPEPAGPSALLSLIRAGFSVYPFHCFTGGRRCTAWAATSSFVAPTYATSLRLLRSSCRRRVASALLSRMGGGPASHHPREVSSSQSV